MLKYSGLAGLLSLLVLWPTLRDLPSSYGYEWGQFVPEREVAQFIVLGFAFAWIVWMDARPAITALLVPKAPLDIKPGFMLSPHSSGWALSATNSSPVEIENVSLQLKNVRYAGILRPPLRPWTEGYLVFEQGRESVSLRPGEQMLAPFMHLGTSREGVEFGPFIGGRTSGGWKVGAIKIDVVAYSKGYPPVHQLIWVRIDPPEKGGGFYYGVGEPSYADLGYPASIQALEKRRRRWLARRLTG